MHLSDSGVEALRGDRGTAAVVPCSLSCHANFAFEDGKLH